MTYGEKKALGWDETIKPCEEGDDRYYLIKSRQDTYKTLEVLADYGADTLIGRGTRVYKVERQSDKKVCVLKDVWIDDDRDTEDVIYENILKSATDLTSGYVFLEPLGVCGPACEAPESSNA